MYDTILVPTDGSPANRRAVEEAVDLAKLNDATVHALYVVDTRDYNTLPEAKWLTLADELQAEGERAVQTVSKRANEAGIDAVTSVDRGVPHETILDYADDVDADVVVMGTHGRTGVERFLLGSVTEKVIRSADVPVLVIRLDAD